jgi:hypothetical protein
MHASTLELVRSLLPPEGDLVEILGQPGPPAAGLAFDAADPALECVFVGPAGVEASYRGVGGFLDGWRDWLLPYRSYEWRLERLIEAGDRVVTLIRVRAVTARDEVELEHAPGAVWTVRDGKVVRVEFYLDPEEALRAAGVAEPAD